MATLAQALPWVLRHEGGWSDDPSDPGGATNHGITLATAQRHGIATAEDLRAITDDQVAAIYRADYWRFDGIDDQRVATKIFDIAVNVGLATAVHLVQDALNTLGACLAEDGRWGPKTEASVNAVDPGKLLQLVSYEQAEYYRAIVAHRPESRKFLAGWLVRAQDCPPPVEAEASASPSGPAPAGVPNTADSDAASGGNS
jgi:type VI secretion system secreted protein VgrG